MKTKILRTLSLRAKFKSYDTVELCIINSQTGEVFVTNIKFRLDEPVEPLSDEELEDLVMEEQENGD